MDNRFISSYQDQPGRNVPDYKNYVSDNIEIVEGEINVTISEDEIAKRVLARRDMYLGDYEKIKAIALRNRDYYRGNQVSDATLFDGEDPIVQNVLFQSIESIIPIATRKTPEPNCTVGPTGQSATNLQEKLEVALKSHWEITQNMKSRMEEGLRNDFCQRYVAYKVLWDSEEQEIKTKLMPMGKLLFNFKHDDPETLPFVIEFVTDTVGNIKKMFPEKAEQIDQAMGADKQNVSNDSNVQYIEYWENDIYSCVWIEGSTFPLFTGENPNWNWQTQEQSNGQNNPYRSFNHFKKPKIPYIFFNYLSFGDSMLDDTSQLEQSIPLQDNVNKRKRQISLNAELANGKMIGAGAKIAKEDFDKTNKDPNQKIYLPGAETAEGAITFEYGRSVDQGVFNDMQLSLQAIDNIMGTHGTTRGEREAQETAQGRTILKESDVGRIEILTRRIEKFAQDLYNYWIQMMYVYYTDKHPVYFTNSENLKALNAKDKQIFIVNTEFANKFVKCLVHEGSTVPRDKATEKAEAVDLWKQGGMATVDLYRILEYPNPEKLARNAFLEKNQPELLYMKPDDGYEISAIEHTMEFGNMTPIDMHEVPPIDTLDPDLISRHIQTHQDYIKGVDIYEDLPSFNELTFEVMSLYVQHVQQETELAKMILASQGEPPVPEIGNELPVMPEGQMPLIDESGNVAESVPTEVPIM